MEQLLADIMAFAKVNNTPVDTVFVDLAALYRDSSRNTNASLRLSRTELDPRVVSFLDHMRITTLGELDSANSTMLYATPGLGKVTWTKINDILVQYGYPRKKPFGQIKG